MIKKLMVISLFLFSTALFAEEATLIDFNKITPEIVIDFTQYAQGYTITEPKVSLEPGNWTVVLNDSADTLQTKNLSRAVAAPTKANGTVLGVRIAFPEITSPSHALILPPFTIPAYYTGASFLGQGIVTNVATIKEVRVSVYGQNYNHSLAIVLQDQSGRVWDLPLGGLQFSGWKDLVWVNGSYIQDVKDRQLVVTPTYPLGSTFVRLVGFKVTKNVGGPTGDFVTYVKSVSLVYDKSTLGTSPDVDDEAVWGIVTKREAEINKRELESAALRLHLIDLEKQRMDTAK